MSLGRKLVFGGLLAALAVDIGHFLLSERYPPFQGPVDELLHLLRLPSLLLVVVLGWMLASAVVGRMARAQGLGVWTFLGLLGVQAISVWLRWRDAGASAYGALTPDVLGGLLLGCACVAVARPLLDLGRVRWVATGLLFFYGSGAALCDLIWRVEGGERGTSWLWRVPVVDLFVPAYASLYGLIGAALQPGRELRYALAGALLVFAAGFVESLPPGQRRVGVALSLAGALLFVQLGAWGSFVSD